MSSFFLWAGGAAAQQQDTGATNVSPTDTGSGVDDAQVAAQLAAADTATGTDAATVAAQVAGADTGTAAKDRKSTRLNSSH